MALIPAVVSAVQVTAHSASLGGIGGSALVYLGSAILFGLIGLVPLLADKPPAKDSPAQWTVVGAPTQPAQPAAHKLETRGVTIDAEFTVLKEPHLLPGEDPRWGR